MLHAHPVPLHQQPREYRGTTYSNGFSGHMYEVKGKNIAISNDRQTLQANYEQGPKPAMDYPRVTRAIARKAEFDRTIDAARQKIATEMSGGEPGLKSILLWHMEYTGGRIEPEIFHGIKFYQVGRNASHDFYAGFKDGERYTYAVGEDVIQDGETEETLRTKNLFIHGSIHGIEETLGFDPDSTQSEHFDQIRYATLGHLRKLEAGASWGYMGHY